MVRWVGNSPITSHLAHATGTSTACRTFLRIRERGPFSRDDFLQFAASKPSPAELFRDYYDRAPATDDLSRMQYLDTKTYLPADVLTKVDRMSMVTSLEVRCPLLDHEFVEWSASLAPHWKLRMGQSKYALKKLAERLGVPRSDYPSTQTGIRNASRPLVPEGAEEWDRADLARTACPLTRLFQSFGSSDDA